MTIKNPPEGYPVLIPYLLVSDAPAAVSFYEKVFDAKPRLSLKMPDGKIGHAELELGDGLIMLAEAGTDPNMSAPDKNSSGRSTLIYLPDIDAAIARAVENGASLVMPADDMFYGDRFGIIRDPFNHIWSLSTRIKNVSPDEMQDYLSKNMMQMGDH